VAFEGVNEIRVRVRDARQIAAQHDEAGDGDEDERENLDGADGVGDPVREASMEDYD
jgi:hypothetical protein